MNQIKTLVFDLMGVIITEKDSEIKIFQEMDKYGSLDDIGFAKWFSDKYNWSSDEILSKTLDYFDACYQIRDFSIFKLASKYKFAIASNHLTAVRIYLQKQNVLKYFSDVVISSEIIFQKPDPKYFETMLTIVKAKPENILFIDDTIENIVTAKKFGLNTFNFNPNHDQNNLREQVEKELLKYQ